jgi:hypothetical protein
LLGHSDYADEFAPSGAGDVMFQGSMYYGTTMDDCAWNPISGASAWDALADGSFLYGYYVSGTDCGGCLSAQTFPVAETPDGGLTYSWVVGDICTFAMVDSGQDMGYYPNQSGPSIGILIKSKEIGAYGPSVNANAEYDYFKLTVQTIVNRNATPITGLYYGSFVDWDVSTADAQYPPTGPVGNGFVYAYGGGAAYGQIGLPSKGSYWPDGTPTDGMLGAYNMHSPDSYWDDLQFTDLMTWAAVPGIVTQAVVTPGTDKAYEVCFGVTNLAAYGEHMFGFATFGIDAGFAGPTDVENLRKFANKYAGFGRGDINNDNVITLADIVRLQQWVNAVPGALGPVPFRHLGDVNNDGLQNAADVSYLAAYFFGFGPPPKSTFMF